MAELAAEQLGLFDADHLEGQVVVPKEPGFTWRSLIPEFLEKQQPIITPEIRRNNIIAGIKEIRAPIVDIEAYSGLSWATWHDAIQAALDKYGAKRIGIMTPFDKKGNESATQMFEELGF